MDKKSMDKNNEVMKTNSLQELNPDKLEKVSGGKSFRPFGENCRICGGIIDNPSVPDELKCHCQNGFL